MGRVLHRQYYWLNHRLSYDQKARRAPKQRAKCRNDISLRSSLSTFYKTNSIRRNVAVDCMFCIALFQSHATTRTIIVRSQSLRDPLVAPRFEFVTRQAAPGRLRDADADVQLSAEGAKNRMLHFGE